MDILIASTKFTHPDGSPWLLSELAVELAEKGNNVTVLNLEWTGVDIDFSSYSTLNVIGVRATRFGNKFSVLIRWLFSSFKLFPFFIRCLIKRQKYDLLVGFSPCVALYFSLPFLRLLTRDACLIYWDFFPIHNQEVTGKIPRLFLPVLRIAEGFLVRLFPRVGCMSPGNLAFFDYYFGSSKFQNKSIIPVWTSSYKWVDNFILERGGFKFKSNSRFFFGGQLAEGRGILELCQAIVEANKENPDISLVICGAGTYTKEVCQFSDNYPGVIIYLGMIPRFEYLKLLMEGGVGVVSTVNNVSVPTFPSKVLDYMACSLPVLAAVEESGDFGDIVEANGFGMACRAGDVLDMKNKIVMISSSLELMEIMGANGRKYLEMNHTVEHVANLIVGG